MSLDVFKIIPLPKMDRNQYFECPHCGETLEFEADSDAEQSYCPTCEGLINASDKTPKDQDNQEGNFQFN